MKDGSVIGDPSNVEITSRAIELGWTPKYGKCVRSIPTGHETAADGIAYGWAILPLIDNRDGGEPFWRDMPQDTIPEIKVSHPPLPWFEEMGLRWFVVLTTPR